MILCLCRAVSDRAILAVVRAGARTVGEVARATGAATDCGSCACDVARMVRGCAEPCTSAGADDDPPVALGAK